MEFGVQTVEAATALIDWESSVMQHYDLAS